MRLSDIKGERTFDVIADIIDPIANIAEDKEAAELFTRKELPKGMTPKRFLLQRARKSVPALLKGHKEDVIFILSTIEGTSPEAYKEALNLAKLFKDCVELLTDEAFTVFFISPGNEAGEERFGSTTESSNVKVSGPLHIMLLHAGSGKTYEMHGSCIWPKASV